MALRFGFDTSIFKRNRGFRLPEGLVAARVETAGQWIEDRLQPWGMEGVTLRSFLPDTFPAYARIFHPFYLREDEALDNVETRSTSWSAVGGSTVSWSRVAAWNGATVHPLMQPGNVARVALPYRTQWGEGPEMGSLPPPECAALTALLREFTTTPESCYLGYWEGYGYFPGGMTRFLGHEPGLLSSIEDMVHHLWGRLRPSTDPLAGVPRLTGQHRNYLLFAGSLDMAPALSRYPPWGQSPSLWWPQDRAWCVATEVDLYDTFVGGSEACIERILNCQELEALPFSIDGRIDAGADMVNT